MLAPGDGIAVVGLCLAALGALHTILKFKVDTISTAAVRETSMASGDGSNFVSKDLCEEREKYVAAKLCDLQEDIKYMSRQIQDLTNAVISQGYTVSRGQKEKV